MNIDLEDLLHTEESPESKISFADIKKTAKDYSSYIWSKKWFVVAAGIIGVIIGIVHAYTYKPTYTATYKETVNTYET